MAISFSFVDNKVYGTEDINDITRSLTGAGIAPFLSKDSYLAADLNAMTSALVGAGVQLGGCKVGVENPATQEMTVTVAQGIVFFESGVRLEVDSDGYTVEVSPGVAGYVFAYYSPALQTADILFDAELPDDGEYVLLGKITLSGEVVDKRQVAQAKIATIGKNAPQEVTLTMGMPDDPEVPETTYAYIEGIDFSKYNYIILETPPTKLETGINRDDGQFALFDIKANRCIAYGREGSKSIARYFEMYTNIVYDYTSVAVINNKFVYYSSDYNGQFVHSKITFI